MTFELMLRDREKLADLITAENGKTRADPRAEVTYATASAGTRRPSI